MAEELSVRSTAVPGMWPISGSFRVFTGSSSSVVSIRVDVTLIVCDTLCDRLSLQVLDLPRFRIILTYPRTIAWAAVMLSCSDLTSCFNPWYAVTLLTDKPLL